MPAMRSFTFALALLLVAAIPARASAFPEITVIDINTGNSGVDSSYPYDFTALDDYLYFNAEGATNGRELWRTNGTTTELVEDINTNGTSGADGSYPYDFTALNGYLYFSANDGTHGRELWRTNGTELGTTLVANINTNGTDGVDSSSLGAFTAFGEWVYFSADDGTHGRELWRTNGTTTEIVEDINATGADSSDSSNFTAFNGYLYFQAADGAHGPELWRTNGTELGTTLVQDINTGTGGADGSYPYALTALGDYLYFLRGADTVNNLWRIGSSGLAESVTPPGTNPNFSCECYPLSALNGRLYMFLSSDETGGELAYLDEPTFVLPPTNRDGSVWSTALVLLAAVTAVAGVGLRMRGAPRS